MVHCSVLINKCRHDKPRAQKLQIKKKIIPHGSETATVQLLKKIILPAPETVTANANYLPLSLQTKNRLHKFPVEVYVFSYL